MTQPATSTDAWISAIRASHDRLSGLLAALDADAIRSRSYATEWSIAQVASHLGSQAEIFDLFLDAGLSGGALPGSEKFSEIWGRWDSSTPERQVERSIESNEALVSRIEGLDAGQRGAFRANLFGNPTDFDGFLAMRLGEHAVHTWDVAVAIDPAAVVSPDAVALLTDASLSGLAARAGRPADQPAVIAVTTTEPARSFVLTTGPEVSLVPATGSEPTDESLRGPAEALLRLVYGRLDVDHTPAELDGGLDLMDRLRPVFQGF